jgi:SAM-dependent methyltransferase
MTEALAERAANAGLANVSTEVTDLKDFRLPPSCADLIISSYALHHLADADKRALTARAAQWLRPGGRLVIADMMFGRGGSRRDRAILRQKVAALAAKGIGGWWRIAKNLTHQHNWHANLAAARPTAQRRQRLGLTAQVTSCRRLRRIRRPG